MHYSLPLAAWLLCFLMPEHFPPWTAYHTEVPAFVAGVAALAVCWRHAARRVAMTGVMLPIVLLLISIVLQWALGLLQYGGDGLVATAYLLLFGAACWWGMLWADESGADGLGMALSGFLVAAGLLLSFQMLAQWLQVEGGFGGWIIDRPAHGRPYGNLGQPNQAGTMLTMASVAGLVLAERGKLRACITWILLVWLAWSIALTQSRTALLSSTLVVGVIWLTATPRLKRNALTWLLIIYGSTWLFHNLDWGVARPAVGNMVAAGLRPLMWRQLLEAMVQHPWQGWGWLQISTAQQAGALQVAGLEQTNFAHNAILDLFLMIGLPAGLALLAWIAGVSWRRAQRTLADRGTRSLLYILIPLLTHAMLEFPHAYAYYVMLAGVMLGAIESSTRAPVAVLVQMPRALLGIVTIVLATLYLGLAVEYAQVEEDFRVNRFENRRLGTTPMGYQPPQPVLLTQFGELLAAMRLRAVPGMRADDLALLQRVSRRFSWAPIQFRAALALGLNGQDEAAHAQLRILKAMFAAEIYEEARDNWLRMSEDQYPQLASVALP